MAKKEFYLLPITQFFAYFHFRYRPFQGMLCHSVCLLLTYLPDLMYMWTHQPCHTRAANSPGRDITVFRCFNCLKHAICWYTLVLLLLICCSIKFCVTWNQWKFKKPMSCSSMCLFWQPNGSSLHFTLVYLDLFWVCQAHIFRICNMCPHQWSVIEK